VSEHRYEMILQAIRTIAAGAGLELSIFFAETPGAYPAAFTAIRAAGAEALIIVSAPEFNRDAEILAALAVEAKLPTVCEWRRVAYLATAPVKPSCVVVPRTFSCASFAGARPATCRLRGRLRADEVIE